MNDKPPVTVCPPDDLRSNLTRTAMDPVFMAALPLSTYAGKLSKTIDSLETVRWLRDATAKVRAGDMTTLEEMLFGQAAALNVAFSTLMVRSADCMGQDREATESYFRLALKAQAQSRATLETLAQLKCPSVVFAKQANINQGGQLQVNNMSKAASTRSSRARISESPPNELSDPQHDLRPHTPASRRRRGKNTGDPALDPVVRSA